MPRRLLRCFLTGAGGQADKRKNDTQHAYSPRVVEEHTQCPVPPREGRVRVFAPVLPPAGAFGVQFIPAVPLQANLFIPFSAEALLRNCAGPHSKFKNRGETNGRLRHTRRKSAGRRYDPLRELFYPGANQRCSRPARQHEGVLGGPWKFRLQRMKDLAPGRTGPCGAHGVLVQNDW